MANNSSNSGSPVFNLDGEVMGIVSNIISKPGLCWLLPQLQTRLDGFS